MPNKQKRMQKGNDADGVQIQKGKKGDITGDWIDQKNIISFIVVLGMLFAHRKIEGSVIHCQQKCKIRKKENWGERKRINRKGAGTKQRI